MSDIKENEDFVVRFCEAIDSNREELINNLDEDAMLHWFTRTIVGSMAIFAFFKRQVEATKHRLRSVETTGPIQFMEVTYDGNSAALDQEMGQGDRYDGVCANVQNDNCGEEYLSEEMDSLSLKSPVTPKVGIPQLVPNAPQQLRKRVRITKQACGDKLAVLPMVRLPGSTAHFLEARGYVDFCKTTYDMDSGMQENLQRTFTLKIGYTKTSSNDRGKAFIIIYELDPPPSCRKNLGTLFQQMENDDSS